jgi:hypothetical protein
MEPDGILNGSAMNDLRKNTAKMTGNKPAVYSIHQGCLVTPAAARRLAKTNFSANQATKVTISRHRRISGKLNEF